jgi:hypothetical protein
MGDVRATKASEFEDLYRESGDRLLRSDPKSLRI